MRRSIALITLIIALGFVNWSIVGKENHLANGTVVYLDLRPVDPRSLIQGDYMALRFRLADEVHNSLPKKTQNKRSHHNLATSDGYVVVSLDEQSIGTFKYIYNDQALSTNEILMRYRVRNGAVKFATNAFFFQEGHDKYYRSARYGQFRVDDNGELLLAAMFSSELTKLKPDDKQQQSDRPLQVTIEPTKPVSERE